MDNLQKAKEHLRYVVMIEGDPTSGAERHAQIAQAFVLISIHEQLVELNEFLDAVKRNGLPIENIRE